MATPDGSRSAVVSITLQRTHKSNDHEARFAGLRRMVERSGPTGASGGRPQVVWLRASGELLAERRGARAADRDAYIVDAAGGAEPSVPHLAVDASLTIPQQVAAIKRGLAAGRPLPVDSSVSSPDAS